MRLRPRALFLPICVIILVTAATTVPLPLFVESPGAVISLIDHVEVAPGDQAGEIDGDFLLTLVNLRRATVVRLAQGLVRPDMSLLSVAQLTGGVDDATFFGRQRDVFASTAEVAAGLGLQAAGHPVEFPSPRGVLVAEVFPGAPAAGALEPGDIVTAVDGEPVRSAHELVEAVQAATNPVLRVEFLREEQERRVRIARGQVPGLDQPGLGVRAQEVVPRIELPIPVTVDSGQIGGPSAGLMIALTVYDTVSPDDLAAGRRVAGTGGITTDGAVTPIGGIELKVLASHRQGVELFLAPQEQLDQARAAVPDGSTLQVVGVATVDDAIRTLQATAGSLWWVPDTGVATLDLPAAVSTGRVRGAVPRDVTP